MDRDCPRSNGTPGLPYSARWISVRWIEPRQWLGSLVAGRPEDGDRDRSSRAGLRDQLYRHGSRVWRRQQRGHYRRGHGHTPQRMCPGHQGPLGRSRQGGGDPERAGQPEAAEDRPDRHRPIPWRHVHASGVRPHRRRWTACRPDRHERGRRNRPYRHHGRGALDCPCRS